MTDTTILDRLTTAGLDETKARTHLTAGLVRHQGAVVTDPQHPAPWPTPWVIGPQ